MSEPGDSKPEGETKVGPQPQDSREKGPQGRYIKVVILELMLPQSSS